MKYIILLCDGMSDLPLDQLEGKTPMEAAHKPHMDQLAKVSEMGLVKTIPDGMSPGSDTANLSVIGYDPLKYYSGRSPLEALSIGVDMLPTDVSYRCNLVTLSEEPGDYQDKIILDHSADEITTQEAVILLNDLKKYLEIPGYTFYPGISYRHLLIQSHGRVIQLTPPHDILDRRIGDYLPTEPVFLEMMKKSYTFLNDHPVNQTRRSKGLRPANSAWFWGAGTAPSLPSFFETFQKKGAMTSAVDLLKGIAVGAGLANLQVPTATGGLNNDYLAQAKAAVKALLEDKNDFVYIHIEAPDEMGHQGDIQKKIQAIEYIDELVVPTLTQSLSLAEEDFRLLILPDHPTPIALRTHSAQPVPYLLYDSRKKVPGDQIYSETTAQKTGIMVDPGYTLIRRLFSDGSDMLLL